MSFFDRLSKKLFSADRELSAQEKQLSEQLRQQTAQADLSGAPASFTERLEQRVKELVGQCRPKDDSEPPVSADGVMELALSRDRMMAYACIFPPLFGGAALTEAGAKATMQSAQILYGIDGDALRQALQEKALRIFTVAHGTPSVDGADGKLEERFARTPLPQMELTPNGFLEFDRNQPLMQPVKAGEVICKVCTPVPAQPGHDVLGRELAVRAGIMPALSGGEQTHEENHQLLADTDGVVYWDDTQFAVKPWKVFEQELNAPTQHLKLKGNFYVSGSISGGASLEVDGNLAIDGQILDGSVTVSQNLIVRQGIHCCGQAAVKVGGQLQCPVIEQIPSLDVKGNIFADEILNSTVTSEQDIFVLGGRGLVSGGMLTANSQVNAKQVGEDGVQTALAVGMHGDLIAAVSRLKEQLEQLTAMQERLRKKIITMRAASSVLSQERREEFTQMQEESKRLANQEKDLKQQLKNVRETLATSLSGKVVCQTLRTPVKVRIGNYEETLVNPANNCNIHVYLGSIVTR